VDGDATLTSWIQVDVHSSKQRRRPHRGSAVWNAERPDRPAQCL